MSENEHATEEVYDVVVVGGGGAGLAAAVEAAALGDVVILEKAPLLGGTTAMAVGSITASGTRQQSRLGVEDSPDEHLEDYRAMAGERLQHDNPELSRLLVDNVGATVDWLTDMGVEFFGPMQEPPHRKPRMHNVLPSARSYVYHLSRRARALGTQVRTRTAAVRLLRDRNRVSGVLAQGPDGGVVRYIARSGVVLAGGDFSNNVAFRRDHFGEAAAGYASANPYATGDCQRIAIEIGARICNADLFDGPQMRFPPAPSQSWMLRIPPFRAVARAMRWALDHLPSRIIRPFALGFVTTYLAPDPRLFTSGALIVDRSGQRQPELNAISASGPASSPPGAYVILDASLYERFCAYPHYIATAPNVAFAYADDFRRNRGDVFFSAQDVEGLASLIGIPAEAVQRSVAEHNRETAAGGADGESGPLPILTPPFSALGPVLPYVLTTHGGLAVSRDLEVLDGSDRPIEGLYAAGTAGRGGLLLPGHGHSLGWAFTSGRLAGRHAAGRRAGA